MRLGFVLMLSIVIGGCAGKNKPDLPQQELIWMSEWLDSRPCELPCWQDITPGTTTITDAIELVSAQPFVADVTYGNKPSNADLLLRASWSSRFSAYGGYFVTHPASSQIKHIILYAPRLFTFDQVKAAFGEPSHIIALRYPPYEEHPSYTVVLIYEQQGLQAEVPNLETEPLFDELLTFDQITFFVPSTKPPYIDFFPDARKALQPWVPGKPFSWYCHDGYTYDPCE